MHSCLIDAHPSDLPRFEADVARAAYGMSHAPVVHVLAETNDSILSFANAHKLRFTGYLEIIDREGAEDRVYMYRGIPVRIESARPTVQLRAVLARSSRIEPGIFDQPGVASLSDDELGDFLLEAGHVTRTQLASVRRYRNRVELLQIVSRRGSRVTLRPTDENLAGLTPANISHSPVARVCA